jgi:hypothetical protein
MEESMKKWVLTLLMALLMVAPTYAELEETKADILQNAAVATGDGTAIEVSRYTSIALQVTIADTATVTFEATQNGTTWASAVCTSSASTSAALVTSATATGLYQCPVAGFSQFRARISSWTGGAVTVTARATTAVLGKKGGGGGAGDPHELLSATHSDSTAASGTQGDIIQYDSSWEVLALGANGECLKSNGTLAVWDSCAGTFADIAAGTSDQALVVGTGGSLGVSGSGTIAATTAAALAANAANCSAGSGAGGVTAAGAAEGCTDYMEEPGSTGVVVKTGEETVAARTITGTANEITVTNGDGVSGNPTLSLPATINVSSKTLRIPNGTELPATCTVGDQFMDTNATTGQRHYLCESADTWALQGDGGGAGEGTVTSVDATGGVETASGSAIETTGTIRGAIDQRADTGTTDTVLTGDRGKLVTWSDADPVAVTLPQAGTGFEDKWWFIAKNIGVGDVTITPTTSTIDGDASLVLATGQFTIIVSDGTNYTSTGVAILAEVDTIQSVVTRGAEVTSANSEANAVLIGASGTGRKWKIYDDATDGLQIVCYVTTLNNCDYLRKLNSGKKGGYSDRDGTERWVVTESQGTTALTKGIIDATLADVSLTTSTKINFPAVGCSGTTGTLMLDTNATLAPTAACAAGSTNTTAMFGYAEFPDSDGEYQVQISPFRLPADFTGAIDIAVYWRAAATSGDVIWQTQTFCTSDAEVEDVAWNTADAFAADTAKGTTLQLNTVSDTSITITNCAAGDIFHLKLFRQRTHASDTISGVVQLKNFELTVRRAQ